MVNEAESAALVVRAASGETAAFELLVRQHQQLVFRWALVLAADRDDADDLAQAVWIKAHQSLGGYRGDAKFTTWLYRILFNLRDDERRTRVRRTDALSRWQVNVGGATGDSPQDDLDAERLVTIVKRYLGDLPPRQRAVFAMADFEEIPAREIAERLQIPEVTVRTNLLKARRAIRKRLLLTEPRLVQEYRS